jgi:hypothetical protein
LTGGSGEDILVGGTTAFDAGADALAALAKEWDRTDLPYARRVQHILNGGGLNGDTALYQGSFTSNGAVNTLLGKGGLDLFFGFHTRDVSDWKQTQGEMFIDGATLGHTQIDTAALSMSVQLDGGEVLDPGSIWVLSLAPGMHTLTGANGAGGSVEFSVTSDGLVDYDPSLNSVLSGRDTTTLGIQGATVRIDATALESQSDGFAISGLSTHPTAVVQTFTLLPGSYLFQAGSLQFPFSLSEQDQVDFDLGLENHLSGRGTNTLTVS